MTAKETITEISKIGKCYSSKRVLDALESAKRALNKQIPLEVNYISDGDADGTPVYDEAECQSCGYVFDAGCSEWEEVFCHHCGQALKWDTGTISRSD